jgi:hypothetical protein
MAEAFIEHSLRFRWALGEPAWPVRA